MPWRGTSVGEAGQWKCTRCYIDVNSINPLKVLPQYCAFIVLTISREKQPLTYELWKGRLKVEKIVVFEQREFYYNFISHFLTAFTLPG